MCDKGGLKAGFAKIDITPDFQVGLGGYSNAETRRSEGIAERIYASCIALTDGGETILIYTIDNCACNHDTAEKIRGAVTATTGIAGEKIFCSATHSHSCPAMTGHPEAEQYTQLLLNACAEGAQKALEDRSPATVMAVKKRIPGMNFVRHFELADGTVVGRNFRRFESPVVGFAGPTDDEMILVKFAREEKKDILLVNWQGHPDCGRQIGHAMIAPSYVGPLRDTLAVGSGMEVAYFTGADGNLVINSMLPEYAHGLDWRRYGVKMATLALDALEDMQEVEGSGIRTARAMVEVEIDHSWDHMLEQANEVYTLWKATDRPTGDEYGKRYGFSSVYQSRAIRTRYQMPKTTELEINAFRVGGVGFTTGTYEMFSDSGIHLKARSPYDVTMVLTGNSGYIPSERAHANRCYESDTGLFAKGAAEVLVDKYVELLKKIQ